jgi:hypothetical protein
LQALEYIAGMSKWGKNTESWCLNFKLRSVDVNVGSNHAACTVMVFIQEDRREAIGSSIDSTSIENHTEAIDDESKRRSS